MKNMIVPALPAGEVEQLAQELARRESWDGLRLKPEQQNKLAALPERQQLQVSRRLQELLQKQPAEVQRHRSGRRVTKVAEDVNAIEQRLAGMKGGPRRGR